VISQASSLAVAGRQLRVVSLFRIETPLEPLSHGCRGGKTAAGDCHYDGRQHQLRSVTEARSLLRGRIGAWDTDTGLVATASRYVIRTSP
jgi:hypothetical protein